MPLKKKEQKPADTLENEKEQIRRGTGEMSAELKRLLESEISAFRKREKHRSTEMIAIFARHNFYANGLTPQELRTTLEDLGPTYVKIGQIMSSRVDLLPAKYCRELEKLRNSVKPLDPAVAKAVIEQETGRKIDEIYTEFRDEPLGSASIAQVHYGVLRDGTRVVTKVQRPLIADMMRKDFVLLNKLADLVNVIGEDSDEQVIDFKSVIAEVERVTKAELDFRVEAENTRLFRKKCLDDEERISCPAVIDSLTTERIFTMTYIDGCSVADTEKLIAEGCDPNEIGRVIVDSYLHQVLDAGIFHADPHQGNILVSHGKPYWIDFGMIGRVTDKDIDLIQDMVKALLLQDADSLVSSVMGMGAASEKTDRARLTRDAEMFIEKYMNVKSVSDINVTEVFDEVMTLAARNHVSMPGRFTMLARSLTTMEGVVEQLCPDLNIFSMLYDKLKTRARQKMNIPRELLEKGNELVSAGKKAAGIPLLASEVLEGMVKGKTRVRVELSEYEEPLNRILRFLRYTVLTLVALVLFIGSCILCTTDFKPLLANGMPLPAVAGIVFSIALTIFSVKRLK